MARNMIGALWLCVLLCLSSLAHAQSTGTVTYVYSDPQGTALAEADAQGTITATFDYQPYGTQALGSAPNGPGYTGHVNDPDTGLVYMQARYYDPALARFLSVDPVTPSAGNSFNFNRYIYVNNNPLVRIDPDGRQASDPSMTAPCGGCIRPPAVVLDGASQVLNFLDEASMAYPGATVEHAAAVPMIATLREASAAAKLARMTEAANILKQAQAAERAEILSERVNVMRSVLDPFAAKKRTIAALDTAQGTRVIASGGRDLSPAQRALISAGEAAAKSPGAHAEVTALAHAAQNGLTPVQMSVSRTICPSCAARIEESGGHLTSPKTAEW